jgi:D-proline reductase (dithiol) PrdB
VDGYRFLPPSLAAWMRTFIPHEDFKGSISWTPMTKPLSRATMTTVTSAGISLKSDPPFDMEIEKRDPTRSDISYRDLPRQITEGEIHVNHLHINTNHIKQDINVILPLLGWPSWKKRGSSVNLPPPLFRSMGFNGRTPIS